MTTFIVPGELFATEIRATCHGISAAAGKVGAIIGVVAFEPITRSIGVSGLFGVCAGVSFTGLLLTVLCIPETKKLPLFSATSTAAPHPTPPPPPAESPAAAPPGAGGEAGGAVAEGGDTASLNRDTDDGTAATRGVGAQVITGGAAVPTATTTTTPTGQAEATPLLQEQTSHK
eukprot:TRINITY_DN4868_c0_g1_i1.p1 TRINITY_DN4868_c0_g1~~TRINITY_DN4868_c0_g1_i1.p1  ORF type:complete len:174 (+),score=81.30 TRINITY_DN4868_c0_g1_i1:100-621(+)